MSRLVWCPHAGYNLFRTCNWRRLPQKDSYSALASLSRAWRPFFLSAWCGLWAITSEGGLAYARSATFRSITMLAAELKRACPLPRPKMQAAATETGNIRSKCSCLSCKRLQPDVSGISCQSRWGTASIWKIWNPSAPGIGSVVVAGGRPRNPDCRDPHGPESLRR